MENLLNPDVGMMVWTVVVFLLLVFVVSKYAWGPIVKALNEREAGIRRAIDDAAQARETAEKLKVQLAQELAASQTRAQAMLAEARADAQKIKDQMLKDAEAESARLSEQTRRQLAEEKDKIARELREQVVGLSIQAAEKVLRHAMNAKEQETIVKQFLEDLGKMPKVK